MHKALAPLRWLFLAVLALQTIPFGLGAQSTGERLLAGAELAGIVLFAFHASRLAGAALLLLVFAAAAAVHLRAGQHPIALIHPALLTVTLLLAERGVHERA